MYIKATTIVGILRNGEAVLAGDGQVTASNVIMKHRAYKLRSLCDGKIIAGFAGSAADAFALFERFEAKLSEHGNNLTRASVELAKLWRTDRYLRRLEALLLVSDGNQMYVISGNGDVVEPDHGAAGIGSGGNFALAAARALMRKSPELSNVEIAETSMNIASELCPFTNDNIRTLSVKKATVL